MNTTLDLFNASNFEKDHIHDFMSECEGLNYIRDDDKVKFDSKDYGKIEVRLSD